MWVLSSVKSRVTNTGHSTRITGEADVGCSGRIVIADGIACGCTCRTSRRLTRSRNAALLQNLLSGVIAAKMIALPLKSVAWSTAFAGTAALAIGLGVHRWIFFGLVPMTAQQVIGMNRMVESLTRYQFLSTIDSIINTIRTLK